MILVVHHYIGGISNPSVGSNQSRRGGIVLRHFPRLPERTLMRLFDRNPTRHKSETGTPLDDGEMGLTYSTSKTIQMECTSKRTYELTCQRFTALFTQSQRSAASPPSSRS